MKKGRKKNHLKGYINKADYAFIEHLSMELDTIQEIDKKMKNMGLHKDKIWRRAALNRARAGLHAHRRKHFVIE